MEYRWKVEYQAGRKFRLPDREAEIYMKKMSLFFFLEEKPQNLLHLTLYLAETTEICKFNCRRNFLNMLRASLLPIRFLLFSPPPSHSHTKNYFHVLHVDYWLFAFHSLYLM